MSAVHRFREHALPLVLEPASAAWAGELAALVREDRAELLASLRRHGALLFRGFSVENAASFREVFRGLSAELSRYVGGDSPRAQVTDGVYTSTSYPAALPIPLHNEMSYSRQYPSILAFYCETASREEGETPLADCRLALQSLSPVLRQRLEIKSLRYVQNLGDKPGLGKTWRQTFETDDRAEVERVLQSRGAELSWKPDGSLRIAETVAPIVAHPLTGEAVLFCQPHLWHVSILDEKTRRALTRLVAEDELYHHCSYGDGSPIPEEDVREIRAALEAASAQFRWRPRDLLLVDNLLVAHGRNRYSGDRRILVSLGAPAGAAC